MLSFPNDLAAMDNLAQELIKMNVNPMEMDELQPRGISSTGEEEKVVAGVTPRMKHTQEKSVELKSAPTQPSTDAGAEERRSSFKLEMTELIRTRTLKDQKRVAQREGPRKAPELVNSMAKISLSKSLYQAEIQENSQPKSLPSKSSAPNPSLEPRSLAPELKTVFKTTAAGHISPLLISRTAQVSLPKNASRPQKSLSADPSLEPQSMSSKTKPASRRNTMKVAPTDPPLSALTNHPLASEPAQSSMKITQTQTTEAAGTPAINTSTTKVSQPVGAVPKAVPFTFEFKSTSSARPNVKRPGSNIPAKYEFLSDSSASPYADDADADADVDSDEEL